jgi:hypothetical protein
MILYTRLYLLHVLLLTCRARRQLQQRGRARAALLLPHSVQLTSGVPSRVFAQNTA